MRRYNNDLVQIKIRAPEYHFLMSVDNRIFVVKSVSPTYLSLSLSLSLSCLKFPYINITMFMDRTRSGLLMHSSTFAIHSVEKKNIPIQLCLFPPTLTPLSPVLYYHAFIYTYTDVHISLCVCIYFEEVKKQRKNKGGQKSIQYLWTCM